MKNIFKYFALLPLLASCDDKKIETNLDYLTQKKWYLESAMVTVTGGGMDTTYDMAAIMPACRLDDFWQYNENKTYINNNRNTKYDESEEQIQERGYLGICRGIHGFISKQHPFYSHYTKLRFNDSSKSRHRRS